MKIAVLLLLVAATVNGDMYLHNPRYSLDQSDISFNRYSFRGSNNRLDEANRDRNNANR